MEDDIFDLLEEPNKVMLNLLEIISESHNWYSVSELSIRLSMVERTVQRYIHQLEDAVAQYNEVKDNYIQINYEKYNGIQLETQSGSNYMEFKTYLLSNDETMQVLKKILFEEFYSVKKYAMTYFVSENSVRKSLKKIKQFLSLYDLSLSRSTFKLEGEEKKIRIITYIIGWVTFKGVTWPFDAIDQLKVYNTVDRFSNIYKINFSNVHRKQMAYMLAVNLIRFRKNHIIKLEPDWKNYVNIQGLLQTLPLLADVADEYHIHVESEIYFYVLLLQMKIKVFESDDLRHRIFSYHEKCQSDIFNATKLFVDRFHERLIAIPEELKDRFFLTSFCAHLYCKVFNQLHVDIDGHQISKETDYDYPTLKENLSYFIQQLYKESGHVLFLEKEFLIQKYLLLFSSISPLNYYEPAIRIFLDSDLPFFVKQNIMTKINDRFKYDFNIQFQKDQVLHQSDIILTNIPNTTMEEQRFTYKVHLFDFPIKLRDFIEIERKLRLVALAKTQPSS
ncbi:helix-turn-helix domain-containing protein [Enterococcus sp. AZ126]|uniref:helix-turn-helix domain-containing protein n=1 Tax=Enterococcus sp. AZ126 TaxID=2774635 RepID=UPI003F2717F6